MSEQDQSPVLWMGMTRYQWLVILAAWLGWGFDVFDGLLFNYVAPNCVPTLLGLKIGSPEAGKQVLYWNGILTSCLLIGWGVGGIIFGKISDRIGRTKTLLYTMLTYALGTALCAFAQNLPMLFLFRIIASLGIGGEWAAGASMVAEVVPESKRVQAGAILYTSAPMGLFLATFVTKQIQGNYFSGTPEVAWRYVFLTGLIPAFVAFAVRHFVKEPERWKTTAATTTPPRVAELFTPQWRKTTLSGLAVAIIALITWWSCNAFLPTISSALAATQHVDPTIKGAAQKLAEEWKAFGTNLFNIGGLIGTLLTIPIANHFGRRKMFFVYFLVAAITILVGFNVEMAPHDRLWVALPLGLSVFGVFGSFTYYLPELFPTRLRSTGAGFCYNAGRFIAAGGPFLVGWVASQGKERVLEAALSVLSKIGYVPLLGLLLLPFVIETKGRQLPD